MSRLVLRIRKPSEQVAMFEWPTGSTITAITVTTSDDGHRFDPMAMGVPAELSHFMPNSSGSDTADVVWSGELFKHGKYSAAIPLQLQSVLASSPGSSSSKPFRSSSSFASTSSSSQFST